MIKTETLPSARIGSALEIKRIACGLWQVAGGHGPIDFEKAVRAMRHLYDQGFTTFDMADHYGAAEDIAGALFAEVKEEGFPSGRPQIMTKWVPEPGKMDESIVRAAVERALNRLKTEAIDLIQFHWWDYLDPGYLPALTGLAKLKEEGLIREIGLTNFDTPHARILTDMGFPVASNQVHFSLLDDRPAGEMSLLCLEQGIKLLCYGTLAGGFLSERWLGKPEPTLEEVKGNWSLMKYLRFIKSTGGWSPYQRLLSVLSGIARKHGVGIGNVATRWVLEHPTVGAVLVGAKLGFNDHSQENLKTFSFKLEEEDHEAITEAREYLKPLPGDCGDEYRKPPFLTAAGDLSDHKTHAWRLPLAERSSGNGDITCSYDTKTVWEEIAGFSRAVRRGKSIFISGTTATYFDQAVPSGSAASQAEVCLDKIEAALEALGGRLSDVVRTRIYLPRLEEDWEAVARVHGRRFGEIKPANTLVGAALVGREYLVEMEAEAIIQD